MRGTNQKNDYTKSDLNSGLYKSYSDSPGTGFDGLTKGAMSQASSLVGPILEVGQGYAEAFGRDYNQDIDPFQYNTRNKIDIGAIGSQDYQRDPFAYGDILKGVKAGAQGGLAFGPQGALIGAGVGALAGTGSALVKHFKQNSAENDFNREKSQMVRGAIRNNSAADFRDRVRTSASAGMYNQYARFYG